MSNNVAYPLHIRLLEIERKLTGNKALDKEIAYVKKLYEVSIKYLRYNQQICFTSFY